MGLVAPVRVILPLLGAKRSLVGAFVGSSAGQRLGLTPFIALGATLPRGLGLGLATLREVRGLMLGIIGTAPVQITPVFGRSATAPAIVARLGIEARHQRTLLGREGTQARW